jgi:hypothetical protein
MIYAFIKGGVVVNTVVLTDTSYLSIPAIAAQFDSAVRVDNIVPQPGMGWSYDGTNWTPPPPPDGD